MGISRLGLAACLSAALFLASCAPPGSGSGSDDTLDIALLNGVTGPSKEITKDFVAGADAAVDAINAEGGVRGRTIKVEVLDTRSDPTHAVSLLTDRLASGDEPDAVVTSTSSAEALALLPLATDTPLFSLSSAVSPKTNDPGEYPYHFGLSPTPTEQLAVLGRGFKADRVKRLAVVAPSDAFGNSLVDGIKTVARRAHVNIVHVERPDPQALNFTVEWQRVLAAEPDAVFFDFASQESIARFLSARLAADAAEVTLYGGGSTGAAVPAGLAEDAALKNCRLPVFRFTDARNALPAYLRPLAKAFHGSGRNIYSGGMGFDMVHIAALAFERAGDGPDPKSLAAALTDKPVPRNRLALYPGGTTYTATSHFPEVTPKSMNLVPCDAQVVDGFWTSRSQ